VNKVSVLIATTDGPVQVQRLAEEDPEVRSVICLNGTSEALPISAAYDAFVRKPTGVIERLFGHPVFRMDVSAKISDGHSWQLGIFAAHALHARGELAERLEDATHVLWLTGEVNNDHEVKRVDHVAKKLELSAAMLCGLAEGGGKVILGYPKGNVDEVEHALTEDPGLADAIFQAAPLESTNDLFVSLFLEDEATVSIVANAVEINEKNPVSSKLRLAGIVAALALVLAGVLGWNMFGEISRWRAMAASGAYEKLLFDIENIKNNGCLMCRAAARVYPVVAGWRSSGQGDLELTASEIHAPAGRSCSPFRFDRIDGEERLLDVASPRRFADSSIDGLCGVLYRIRNAGSRPFHAFLRVRPRSAIQNRAPAQRRNGARYALLAPGKTLAIRVKIPEWLRRDVIYGIHAIIGEGPINDVGRWAIGDDRTKPDRLRKSQLAILGLTARSMVHRVRLIEK